MKVSRSIAVAVAVFLPVVISARSAYISKVLEFCPAPGQFVNEVPWWESGWNTSDMTDEAALNIVGSAVDPTPGMISLGSFGGYVIFAFDHPVVNVPGEYDFKIFGNAVKSETVSDGGSSEPGIVMVSVDSNGNGLPDDEWFELAGSEHDNNSTRNNYRITYYRPDDNKVADPDPVEKYILDRTYIRWTSNNPDASEGYVMKNSFHRQNYWPEWIAADELTFEGTLLPDNSYKSGSDVVLRFFSWGYADNKPNDEDPGFNLDWAVDSEGNAVHLTHADFFKVYTAMNQYNGRTGESSTEISGGQDLHPDAVIGGIGEIDIDSVALLSAAGGVISLNSRATCKLSVYSLSGMPVGIYDINPGRNDIDVSSLSRGIYIISVNDINLKIKI